MDDWLGSLQLWAMSAVGKEAMFTKNYKLVNWIFQKFKHKAKPETFYRMLGI
jgi:hypothetical protein